MNRQTVGRCVQSGQIGLCFVMWCSTAFAAEFAVFPSEIALTGPESRQRVLVQSLEGERIGRQLTTGVTLSSSDEGIARVENEGTIVPTGNGTAMITVKVGGASQVIPVQVSQFDQPHVWSFRNQVQSVLSKTGCNMGACHGAAAGKNGFRLSLRGYDPEGDFNILTRQARGRRIVPHDPGRSLILTKPTGTIPHKGGLRFTEDSLEYRVIAEWIAQGQPAPTPDDLNSSVNVLGASMADPAASAADALLKAARCVRSSCAPAAFVSDVAMTRGAASPAPHFSTSMRSTFFR